MHCSLISRLLLLIVSTHVLRLTGGTQGRQYCDGLTILGYWIEVLFSFVLFFLIYNEYNVFNVDIQQKELTGFKYVYLILTLIDMIVLHQSI